MLKNFIHDKIKGIDVFIGFAVVIFLTYHPYYLHQKINFFELGLYLPGIQSILDGQMPYKDFFYLRAPLDLYFAALSMKIFGVNVAVLCTYFYLGTVLTLCACLLLVKEIFPSRLLFYVFIPALVLGTYSLGVFINGGGLHYAWGLLAIWCVIKFIRKKKRVWILLTGLLTVVTMLTSIEIGVCVGGVITVTLACVHRRGLMVYWILLVTFLLPYNYYLAMHGAWRDFFNTQIVVATQLTQTFSQKDLVPSRMSKNSLIRQENVRMNLPRLNGLVIPKEQAEDILMINHFVNQHVKENERILMYPELGAMHFIVNRPWVGHFSTPTYAWYYPTWAKEWMGALQKDPPRYAVLLKQIPDYFDSRYFQVESNRGYFNETMDFIEKHFERIDQTPNYWILRNVGLKQ